MFGTMGHRALLEHSSLYCIGYFHFLQQQQQQILLKIG